MDRAFDWKRLSFILWELCKLIEPSTIYSQKDLVVSRKGTISLTQTL
jgi:hypothetical protein